MLFLTVHHDSQRFLEPHMTDILSLLDGRHVVEDFLLQHAIARISINGKVAHAKRCQVLEKVGAL